MGKYLRDTDKNEQELLTDLFNMLEYENNGRLTINKLVLLSKEKFGIFISDEEAKEMLQALGIKRGSFLSILLILRCREAQRLPKT
jgi:Ca2+-binding EF-hand superfamily protein